MCLGIPMEITEIDGNNATAVAGGVKKEIRLDLLVDAKIGDFVLIHTGYAIERLDPDEAMETLRLIEEVYRAGITGRTPPAEEQ
jgi:hydrogenase expression/formation protein HypC